MKLGHILTAPLASILALLSIVATQAFHGDEGVVALMFGYVFSWFLFFGIAAFFPMIFTKGERKMATVAFFSFGLGGGLSGGLFVISLIFHYRPQIASLMIMIPFILPWLLGFIILPFLNYKWGTK